MQGNNCYKTRKRNFHLKNNGRRLNKKKEKELQKMLDLQKRNKERQDDMDSIKVQAYFLQKEKIYK